MRYMGGRGYALPASVSRSFTIREAPMNRFNETAHGAGPIRARANKAHRTRP